jgi:hypothetical protein
MIGGEVPLLPIVVIGIAALVAFGVILWAERATAPPHFRKLADQPPTADHACPLPWWRPFRKLGERIECLTCQTTWRWDRYWWVPGDSTRMWINEQEEARLAEVEEQAKRAH